MIKYSLPITFELFIGIYVSLYIIQADIHIYFYHRSLQIGGSTYIRIYTTQMMARACTRTRARTHTHTHIHTHLYVSTMNTRLIDVLN